MLASHNSKAWMRQYSWWNLAVCWSRLLCRTYCNCLCLMQVFALVKGPAGNSCSSRLSSWQPCCSAHHWLECGTVIHLTVYLPGQVRWLGWLHCCYQWCTGFDYAKRWLARACSQVASSVRGNFRRYFSGAMKWSGTSNFLTGVIMQTTLPPALFEKIELLLYLGYRPSTFVAYVAASSP